MNAKYKVGDEFIASHEKWGKKEFYVKILKVKLGGKYIIYCEDSKNDWNAKLEYNTEWFNYSCRPLTKLDKVLM